MGGSLVAAGALLVYERAHPPVAGMIGLVGINPTPTATPEPSAALPVPTADPTGPVHVTGGAPPVISHERRLEGELANVRSLLDRRARTTDPTKRRALESDIRAASQRVLDLSPPPAP